MDFLKIALQQALLAKSKSEIPVGCVIVKNKKIIAKAHNLVESSCNATMHAEIIAINKASIFLNSKFLNDCEMYVTLEPCKMCEGAIVLSRIKKVVFGAYSNNLYTSSIPEYYGGFLEEECSLLLKDFFINKR